MRQWDTNFTEWPSGKTVQGVLRDGAEEVGMAKILSPKEPWAIFIQGFETEKGNG